MPGAENEDSPGETEGLWAGVNSADIFDEPDDLRIAMLDTLAEQNIRVIRIWIDWRFERAGIGTFDHALLDRVDRLLEECAEREIKVMIVLHSSFWMVHGDPKEPYLSRWSVEEFYREREARDAYRARARAVIEHRNAAGVPWSELDTIWAWELQNEPLLFGFGLSQSSKAALIGDWLREMAATVRDLDPDQTHIALGTAGYSEYYHPFQGSGDSLAGLGDVPEATIYTLHYYGPGGIFGTEDLQDWIDDAREVTEPLGKLLLVEEFNPMRTDSDQAGKLREQMETCRADAIPWMLWEYGAARDDDDLFHDEAIWRNVVAPEANQMWQSRWTPSGLSWGVNR